jgi:hypothetical protein
MNADNIQLKFPRLNQENNSKVCVLALAPSLKTVLSMSYASGAVFLSLKQNVMQMCRSNHEKIADHTEHTTINTL